MIEERIRKVYYSPRKNRHFMTAKAAAKAEANGRMNLWFPKESPEYEMGHCTDPGWHWSEVPRLSDIHARLVKRYMRQLKPAQPEESP